MGFQNVLDTLVEKTTESSSWGGGRSGKKIAMISLFLNMFELCVFYSKTHVWLCLWPLVCFAQLDQLGGLASEKLSPCQLASCTERLGLQTPCKLQWFDLFAVLALNVCMKFWCSCNFVYTDRHCCNNWPKHQFAIINYFVLCRNLAYVCSSHQSFFKFVEYHLGEGWRWRCPPCLYAEATWTPEDSRFCDVFFLTEQDKAGRNIVFPTVFFLPSVSLIYILYIIYCI